MKIATHTLGCKLNFSETASISRDFKLKGFEIVDFDSVADVYLINTCSVTENAEKECRQIVRRALRYNPEAYVILTGCYAQLRPEDLAAIEGVDLILGTKEKFDLFKYAGEFVKQQLACTFVSPFEELSNGFGAADSTDDNSRTRAYLKIQDGCDYKCSFCTIPAARGLSRSQIENNAVADFEKLISTGYKEVVLTGVNVGDYGKALNTNLHQLIQKLVLIDSDYRLRISSIEPNLLTDDIIALAKENPRLCNHFHIPLQSGSEKILRLMQRRYKKQDFENLIHRIKVSIPDAGIGVDVIVGFPGESAAEFLETYNFIKQLPISYLHVFTYSERPNTKAISMPGSVDVFERRKRTNLLRILSSEKKNEFHASQIGRKVEVLFENHEKEGYMFGFSSNYARIKAPFEINRINKICSSTIISSNGEFCSIDL